VAGQRTFRRSSEGAEEFSSRRQRQRIRHRNTRPRVLGPRHSKAGLQQKQADSTAGRAFLPRCHEYSEVTNKEEVCVGQSGTGAGFLRVLRFPLTPTHSTDCSTGCIIHGCYNRPINGRCDSGLGSIPATHINKTMPNRLTLFGEVTAVTFEEGREHRNTLCGQPTALLVVHRVTIVP
jgi:hypothetical protein